MAFVRGHWRALGWVRSHRRSPSRPAEGQLVLPAAAPVVIPAQRGPVEVPVSVARR
jgi:hypothetical protein